MKAAKRKLLLKIKNIFSSLTSSSRFHSPLSDRPSEQRVCTKTKNHFNSATVTPASPVEFWFKKKCGSCKTLTKYLVASVTNCVDPCSVVQLSNRIVILFQIYWPNKSSAVLNINQISIVLFNFVKIYSVFE